MREKDPSKISMAKFAKEKGVKYGQFSQWRYNLKKQWESGKQIIDPNKIRDRQPKYPQIEDRCGDGWPAVTTQ